GVRGPPPHVGPRGPRRGQPPVGRVHGADVLRRIHEQRGEPAVDRQVVEREILRAVDVNHRAPGPAPQHQVADPHVPDPADGYRRPSTSTTRIFPFIIAFLVASRGASANSGVRTDKIKWEPPGSLHPPDNLRKKGPTMSSSRMTS